MTGDNVLFKNWYHSVVKTFQAKPTKQVLGTSWRLLSKFPTRDPFLESPGTFRARKAIFSSSVSKNGDVYTPHTSCVKGE